VLRVLVTFVMLLNLQNRRFKLYWARFSLMRKVNL